MSQATRVLNALVEGRQMTAKQITAQFGAKNPAAVIQDIRFSGFPVYLNKRTNSKGVTKGLFKEIGGFGPLFFFEYQQLIYGLLSSLFKV